MRRALDFQRFAIRERRENLQCQQEFGNLKTDIREEEQDTKEDEQKDSQKLLFYSKDLLLYKYRLQRDRTGGNDYWVVNGDI